MPKETKHQQHKRSMSTQKSPAQLSLNAFDSSPAFAKLDLDTNNNSSDVSKSSLLFTGSLVNMDYSSSNGSQLKPSKKTTTSVKSRTNSMNHSSGHSSAAHSSHSNDRTAHSRSNDRFHQLFPSVSFNEKVLESWPLFLFYYEP